MAEEEKKDIEKEPWKDWEVRDFCGVFSSKDIMFKAIDEIDARYQSKGNGSTDSIITGFSWLEFEKDELIVLGARPSIGKTAFILSLMSKLILDKKLSVGFIDPGLVDNTKIGFRLLAIDSGVPLAKIRSGMLKTQDVKKLQVSANKFFYSNFYLYNEPNVCFTDLKDTIINMTMEQHIQILFIDNFKYIREAVDADEKTLRTRLNYLLSEFKHLAEELHIPIVIAMELPETKKNEEPSMKDFMKTMIIPEIADKVLFLHRNRLLDAPLSQDAKLILAKNNSGWTGEFDLKFYPLISKFTNRNE